MNKNLLCVLILWLIVANACSHDTAATPQTTTPTPPFLPSSTPLPSETPLSLATPTPTQITPAALYTPLPPYSLEPLSVDSVTNLQMLAHFYGYNIQIFGLDGNLAYRTGGGISEIVDLGTGAVAHVFEKEPFLISGDGIHYLIYDGGDLYYQSAGSEPHLLHINEWDNDSRFSFAFDGSLIAVSTNKITQIVDPASDVIAELRGDCIKFSPAGNYILMADVGMSTVYRFVRTKDWIEETQITLKEETLIFAWDDRSFAVMSPERVEIYTLPERKLIRSISPGAPILNIRFTPQGDKIAILDESERITIWEIATGDRLGAQSSGGLDFDLMRLSGDGKLITIHPEWYDPYLWKGRLGRTPVWGFRPKLHLLEGNKRLVFDTEFFEYDVIVGGWVSTDRHEICEIIDFSSLACKEFQTWNWRADKRSIQSILLARDGNYYVGKMSGDGAFLNIWQGKDLDITKDTWKSIKAVAQSAMVVLNEIIPEKNFVFYSLGLRPGAYNYDINKAFVWEVTPLTGYAISPSNHLIALVSGMYRSSKSLEGDKSAHEYLFKMNVLDLDDLQEVMTKDITATVIQNVDNYNVEEKTSWIEVMSLVVSEAENVVMIVSYDRSSQTPSIQEYFHW